MVNEDIKALNKLYSLHRPDVVVPIFHARLEAFLYNLRHGKYFGGLKTAYVMRVIEYQHRGLPHAHIVFRLDEGPCHSIETECIEWIEKNICSTMPILTESSSDFERRHWDLLNKHMLHKCFRGEINLHSSNIEITSSNL